MVVLFIAPAPTVEYGKVGDALISAIGLLRPEQLCVASHQLGHLCLDALHPVLCGSPAVHQCKGVAERRWGWQGGHRVAVEDRVVVAPVECKTLRLERKRCHFLQWCRRAAR